MEGYREGGEVIVNFVPIVGRVIARFAQDTSGAAIVEYGVALAVILVVVLAVLTGIGDSLATLFGTVEADLAAEAPD